MLLADGTGVEEKVRERGLIWRSLEVGFPKRDSRPILKAGVKLSLTPDNLSTRQERALAQAVHDDRCAGLCLPYLTKS
jgi:hypothetical protein